ncbi:hypothetical protein DMB65_09800 [Flavobacterium cheongpyeongense]|uniref:Secreted protein n=1 Tax=Flavobacterium cheongpyeongense TaxID=2212651 RepID=A0A2V4BPK3_9FLAO|nr:DUF6520 family protein [Flavobacterium cheongpyeongense]PXY40865.1 hypothetical protein DMB65_09800 [Flavobacterium cheongpyeongense]
MKTNFFKNMIPAAVVALGISGAFVTTSMQSASSMTAPRIGYTLDENDECDIEVNCNTTPNPICVSSTGSQAFGKNAQGNCDVQLYKQN